MENAPHQLLIKDFTYELPDTKIAEKPIESRDLSKLLIYKDEQISEDIFKNITHHLPKNSLLVFNNTKVIQARLLFKNTNGAEIEIFCLEPLETAQIEVAMLQKHKCQWKCLIGNAKKFKEDSLSLKIDNFVLSVKKTSSSTDGFVVEFNWNSDLVFAEVLALAGVIPLPPYIKRSAQESDKERYQTVYAEHKGSVAAPTAGLHFTKKIITEIRDLNIAVETITLHVGAGTFMPVKHDSIGEHIMHSEEIIVNKSLIDKILNHKALSIAVGTTSMRTLESLYWLGVKVKEQDITEPENLILEQWEPYQLSRLDVSKKDAMIALLSFLELNNIEQVRAKTQIIIAPSYQFKMVDGLVTNFHQPNSTLLLLVAAFVGQDWRKIYDYALNHDFRFLSYGDSSLLFRKKEIQL